MYKKIAKILTLSAFLAAATGVNAQQNSIQQSIQELATSQSGAIRQLNVSFPGHLSSSMTLSRSQILDFYQKGVNAMRVDISEFKSSNVTSTAVASNPISNNSSDMDMNRTDIDNSDINSSNIEHNLKTSQSISMDQERDFTPDESTTESADIQEPNTLKNTSEKSATDQIQFGDHVEDSNLSSTEKAFTDDSNKSIDSDKTMDHSMDTDSAKSGTVKQDFTLQPETDQQATDIDQNNSDNSKLNTNTNTSSDQTQRVRLSKD